MRKQTKDKTRVCPKCGQYENQINARYNRSGTQRCFCKTCNYKYTLNGKTREYSEEVQKEALRIYYSGVSGRGVGKILGMSKANAYNWIKKLVKPRRKAFNNHSTPTVMSLMNFICLSRKKPTLKRGKISI